MYHNMYPNRPTIQELEILKKMKLMEIKEIDNSIKVLKEREEEEDRKNIRLREQFTLGRLIHSFSNMDKLKKVYIQKMDGTIVIPKDLDSYRGRYEDIAISYAESKDFKVPTVADFHQMLLNVLDTTLSGYHGGDYYMQEDSFVWVSQYGCSEGTTIDVIEDYLDGYRLVLKIMKI